MAETEKMTRRFIWASNPAIFAPIYPDKASALGIVLALAICAVAATAFFFLVY